jgi:hypothetical protein
VPLRLFRNVFFVEESNQIGTEFLSLHLWARKVSTEVDVCILRVASVSSNSELFKTTSAEKSMTDIILESVAELRSGSLTASV